MHESAYGSDKIQADVPPKRDTPFPFWTASFRFSVRSMLVAMLVIAAFFAGRHSRELYPSLWFLGRTEPAVLRQSAYIEAGSTLYLKTNLPVHRLAVRDQTVCEAAADSPSQLRLLAKKPGSTSVLYWQQGREEPAELSIVVAANP
ncbi:MAG: pilus assembly protein N-terminal domain-containing protein [Pirellulales bacterium]